jgi:hypothetical protein
MILSFQTVQSDNGEFITIRPVNRGDKFPLFTDWEVTPKGVIGWVASSPQIKDVQCYDFGRLAHHVAVVSWDTEKVVFKILENPEPNEFSKFLDSDVREIAKAFEHVKFPTGASWDIRFATSMRNKAVNAGVITNKQEVWIYALLYRYRKQLPELYKKYKDNPNCKKLER